LKEEDIWRTAQLLVLEYGASAHEQAMFRARRAGDDQSMSNVWKRVAEAISILQAGRQH
jgi:hypothetical protein